MASTSSHINDPPKQPSSVSYSNDPASWPTLSASSRTSWDVFLSFRGIDTRYNFVSHLYSALNCHGIRAYMDDPELVTGKALSDALTEAIGNSKIYIIVFSENYASSSWCLDELLEIYKSHETRKRLIISVYYKIDPSVVRHQTGSFEKAFKRHETRLETAGFLKNLWREHRLGSEVQKEKVAKWRLTLTEVAKVAGFTGNSTLRSEIDIIDQVVERVLQEIQPKTMYVAKYPVGLDSRVENIIALMSRPAEAEGVTSIGIYGMGGIGKTTLVKAVYNQTYQRFEGSCFLANVRETSKTETGLVRLQQQLIDEVLKCKNIVIDNIDQGIELIRAKFSKIKVLVVIDDLDDLWPMEFLNGEFAQGSVIFITTRNEDLLDSIKVEERYKVKELGNAESLQLFTQHAFQDNFMSDTFTQLSKEIIECAGGLPLALEVIGSMLLKKPEEGWRLFRDKLKRDSNIDVVEKTLLISFDKLELVHPLLKDIFLDIACFFIGWNKEEVVKILDTYYMFSDHNINILKKRCLLTVSKEDKLEMHVMLREMARKIARNDSYDEPGKHSRLWSLEDIRFVLNKQKGTEAVKVIIPSNLNDQETFEVAPLNMETFRRMSKLRVLRLKNINPTGSFEHIFEELRWLCWESCPLECLPPEFHPQQLVTLALPHSKLKVMRKPNMVFENLKTLDMKHSLELSATPNFTEFPCLESLNFEYCKSLEEVHISIGTLERLVFLNLCGCEKLRNIPDSICNLRALTSLNIGGCSSLTELPSELGNIQSLTEVNAWGLTAVHKLPDSLKHLSKSFDLNFSDEEYLETPSSSASDLTPTVWDVYISMRGKDTRSTFTSHLYSALNGDGFRVFKDYELHNGEVLSPSISQAIQESKTYIVILSENFASSTWCLDELVEILKCCKTVGRSVIPVFYNIDQFLVRHQTGSFKQAFEKHETRFAGERVYKWRLALTKVSEFSGHHISKHRFESEIDMIHQVVDRILLEINPKDMYVAEYPVGLESPAENITASMRSHAESVTRIGIYGMGGVGKTTLAKAVYNRNYRNFQGSCFLKNVRETSITERGLVQLQQQLINDVLNCKNIINITSIDQGIELIRAKIRSKVLIVIDDLDNPRTLKFLTGIFAFGSIIFITTRNEDLLDSIKVEERYKVKAMGDAESLQLFTQHAFQDNIKSDTFTELSKEIVECAGGLPLALEVFGSKLLNVSEEGWRFFRHILKRGSIDSNIERTLMISYDALKSVDTTLQDVFLDIACFFDGWDKEEAVKIMETCYDFCGHSIGILVKRCLLTISKEGKLEMHNMVRQMGREIAYNNSPDEPEKHSRLWESKVISNMLKTQKGTKEIKGIIPKNLNDQEALEEVSVNMETFKRMSKLKLLYLKNIDPKGSFEHTFEELRWLCWENCRLECLPPEFHPQKLVTLALPHSKLRVMWHQNVVLYMLQNTVFENLKTLDMKHSLELIATPNFTQLPCLESLNFEYCKSLEEVHISIGTLERLVFLNLSGCVKLRDIPDSICNLRALTSLNIGGCSSLTKLPSELGNIESLTKLSAWGLTAIQKLPESVRRLSESFDLNFSDEEYLETPSSSASDLTPTVWDVYISMRGKDTRSTFTSHLYSALNRHGVRVFKDDDIHSGQVLSLSISQAIQESKTYIVILSQNFASSTWCLNEVVEILNWYKTNGKIVIPVFYNIEPSLVRYQRLSSFEQAFEEHEIRFGTDKVIMWRHALKEITELSGYYISKNRSEADVIGEILERIIHEITARRKV